MAELSSFELDVFNMALGHVGNSAISDVSESPECQLYYPHVRDKLLTWAPWTFATTRQSLTRHADSPPDDEFTYMYVLPSAPPVLRVLDIDTDRFRYQREVYILPNIPETQTPVILTNASSVVLKYIARVSPAVFSPMFIDTLGLWLGLAIAQRISGKTALRKQLFDELQIQLARTIDVDGHQDSPPRALNETYIYARGEDVWPKIDDIEEAL